MSKSSVDRLFIGAIVAVMAGWVVAIVAIIAALAGGAVVIGGPDVVTVDGEAIASALVVLAIAALLVAGGTIAGVASWIGALVNTARLDDKTWFVVLLVLGIWSFGFVAMVAYVMAGPDSIERDEASPGGNASWPVRFMRTGAGRTLASARLRSRGRLTEAPVMAQWRKAWALVAWTVVMFLWLASTSRASSVAVARPVPPARSATRERPSV
jgi:hypothetical protein